MPTFSEAVQESGRLALCALFAGNEAVNALLSPLTGDSLGLYPLTSGLRRQLCSDPPANDPVYEPPFPGGQCNDVYLVTVRTVTNLSGTVTFTRRARGPIGGARLRNISGNNYDVEVFCRNLNPTQSTCGTLADGEPAWRRLNGVNDSTGSPSTSITNVVACGLDNCGDVPPPPGTPGPITTNPPDITYNIDGDTTITVPISFTFSPAYIDFDGSVQIPVTFEVDGLNFDGTVTVSPEFNFEFSPSFDKPGPGTPDDPDAIGEPGGGAEPIPDVEELPSTIVGVLVYSDIVDEEGTGSILFLNGPDIYIPRVASVQFAVKTADSIGWTPDQDVKNLESYVPCAAPQGAVAVRVSPMPGVQSRFTPVRGKPLTSF